MREEDPQRALYRNGVHEDMTSTLQLVCVSKNNSITFFHFTGIIYSGAINEIRCLSIWNALYVQLGRTNVLTSSLDKIWCNFSILWVFFTKVSTCKVFRQPKWKSRIFHFQLLPQAGIVGRLEIRVAWPMPRTQAPIFLDKLLYGRSSLNRIYVGLSMIDYFLALGIILFWIIEAPIYRAPGRLSGSTWYYNLAFPQNKLLAMMIAETFAWPIKRVQKSDGIQPNITPD